MISVHKLCVFRVVLLCGLCKLSLLGKNLAQGRHKWGISRLSEVLLASQGHSNSVYALFYNMGKIKTATVRNIFVF
jgi:hypothetical protein